MKETKDYISNREKNTMNGITLIALIITIILMLILATVTIGVGQGRIFNFAGKTNKELAKGTEIGAIQRAYIIAMDKSKTGTVSAESIQRELDSTSKKINVYDNGTNFEITFNAEEKLYTLSKTGEIISDENFDIESLDKIATGIFAKRLNNNQVEIMNTATNKISYTTIWSGEVAEGFESGDGTVQNPYIIQTAEQFAYFSKFINDGNSGEDLYFELRSDIMLNFNLLDDNYNLNTGNFNVWTPIGERKLFLG